MTILKKFTSRFLSNLMCSILKKKAKKVDSSLCKLYFVKRCDNIEKTLSTLDAICELLEDYKFTDDRNRIATYIDSIIFTDLKLSASWKKSGDIVVKFGPSFSENFLYMLGLLIWFSYSLEYWEKDTSLSLEKINTKSFKKLLLFFHQLEQNTETIEKYFRDAYPSYL